MGWNDEIPRSTSSFKVRLLDSGTAEICSSEKSLCWNGPRGSAQQDTMKKNLYIVMKNASLPPGI